ncbi:MAG: UDP-N-acetylmuramoyl-L-alanine--D-glutamate ligase [Deltaproteobacteria bacterium]
MSRALVPGSALVVGLGQSGVAVAAMLSERGTNVAVTDDDGAKLDAYTGTAAALDRDTATARLGDFDTVVVSPGVACTDPLLVAAAGAGLQVISEFALAARFVEVPLIAITGTNGKSTTVSLLARMLEEAGRTALAAGNIGRPLSSVAGLEADHIVAEVSSFQLEWPGDLSPDVVCLLNIGSDHLDRHRDLATYRRTKLDLFRGPRPPRLAVIAETAGDDIVSAAEASGAELWRFGRTGAAGASAVLADIDKRRLCPSRGAPIELSGPWPRAAHDLDNAAAAAAIALALGVSQQAVAQGCERFEPLEHRLALVARAGGLSFWDDSKATNPDAALASVEAFEGPVVLLVGGDDKGADLSPLATAAARIKGAVAFGAARERLEAVLGGGSNFYRVETLENAFERAVEMAEAGDSVLLAPACSSLDQFVDYAERGRRFAELAAKWAESEV